MMYYILYYVVHQPQNERVMNELFLSDSKSISVQETLNQDEELGTYYTVNIVITHVPGYGCDPQPFTIKMFSNESIIENIEVIRK